MNLKIGDVVRHRRINWLTRERTYKIGIVVEVVRSPRDIVGDYRVAFADGTIGYVLGSMIESIEADI